MVIKMTPKVFLELVELRTKIASMTPFLLANAYVLYHYKGFNLLNFILMLISLLAVDMATTALNNFQDYLTAKKKHGFNYEVHNAVVKYNLASRTVFITIIMLFSIAVVSGLLLYLRTDLLIILLGALSFLVGILYTSGPIPISRTPFGEVFSGFFMGFIITFLTIYIQKSDLINLSLIGAKLNLTIIYPDLIRIFIFSFPLILEIAAIMLANNICDIKDDLSNNRYTLATYLGKERSLTIFSWLYYFSYLSVLAAILLNIVPVYAIIVFISWPYLRKNINIFKLKQNKKETFVLAVKNFTIFNYLNLLAFLLAFIF